MHLVTPVPKVIAQPLIEGLRNEVVVRDNSARREFLRAEMKVPRRAWLEFQVTPRGEGRSLLTQAALFAPRGLFGWPYRYALYPVDAVIFSGMISRIAGHAQASADAPAPAPPTSSAAVAAEHVPAVERRAVGIEDALPGSSAVT